jgi:hypothetical protein
MSLIKGKDLQFGDVVIPEYAKASAFHASVVIQIKGNEVTLFRPYAITSDFTCTAGVIPYLGFEQYKIYTDGNCGEFELVERKVVK